MENIIEISNSSKYGEYVTQAQGRQFQLKYLQYKSHSLGSQKISEEIVERLLKSQAKDTYCWIYLKEYSLPLYLREYSPMIHEILTMLLPE